MILKRNFNFAKVFSYVRGEILFSLLVSVSVYLFHLQQRKPLTIPYSVAAIMGSALAIFIAFRNNSAYSRWWEARSLWGGIVNATRVFARLIITFTDSHAHQPAYNKDRSEHFKKQMINKTIAWAHALRMQLRNETNWRTLEPYLSAQEFLALEAIQNKPNYIQLMAGRKLYEAMAAGTLAGFDSFQLEGQLLALANFQGGCERIKNTPLLRQYDFFTRLFLYGFILILPFALMKDFITTELDFLVIPVSVFISFVFAIMGKVGEVNENPFENKITDVPLTALCNTIERDLLEMLGEQKLPEKIKPEMGYLF